MIFDPTIKAYKYKYKYSDASTLPCECATNVSAPQPTMYVSVLIKTLGAYGSVSAVAAEAGLSAAANLALTAEYNSLLLREKSATESEALMSAVFLPVFEFGMTHCAKCDSASLPCMSSIFSWGEIAIAD